VKIHCEWKKTLLRYILAKLCLKRCTRVYHHRQSFIKHVKQKRFDVLFAVHIIYNRYWKTGSPGALCSEKKLVIFSCMEPLSMKIYVTVQEMSVLDLKIICLIIEVLKTQ